MTATLELVPGRIPKKGLPMGFDPEVYKNVQASLDSIRAQVQALQDQADLKGVREKAQAEWQAVKAGYAQKQERERRGVLQNIDAVFDDHNLNVESQFRRYKPEPAPVPESALKPEVQAGFSAGAQQPVSFDSKWAQKPETKPEPKKKGFFRNLLSRIAGPAPAPVSQPAPHDVSQTVESKQIETQREKNMPQWAQVALSKAKQIDEGVLQTAKDESRGWVQNPAPVATPSFMQQPKPEPKKGFFSRKLSGLADKVASWF